MENNCDWSVTFNRVFSVNLSNRTKTKSRVKCTLKIDSIFEFSHGRFFHSYLISYNPKFSDLHLLHIEKNKNEVKC